MKPSDFVSGTQIQWGKLASVLVGAAFGAFFSGVIRVFLRLGDVIRGLANGFAEFNAALVQLRFGVLASIVAQSWREALGVVESAGPFGFVLAIAIVLTAFYIFQELRPRPWGDDG